MTTTCQQTFFFDIKVSKYLMNSRCTLCGWFSHIRIIHSRSTSEAWPGLGKILLASCRFPDNLNGALMLDFKLELIPLV